MKVLISEDARFVRKRYAALIMRLPSVTKVIETEDVADTIRAIHCERPDVALLDFHLPTGTALDVMRGLDNVSPRPRLFVLSASTDEIPLEVCIRAGAERVFDKAAQLLEALSAVRTIAIENERVIGKSRISGNECSSAASARGAGNA